MSKKRNHDFNLRDVEKWFAKKKITEITGLKAIDCYNWGTENEWRKKGKPTNGFYKKLGPACVYYVQYVKGYEMSSIGKIRKETFEGQQYKTLEGHPNIPYKDQLKRPEWKEFREKVLDIKGEKCEICGTTEGCFQVHHPKYKHNHYAWEYSPDEVQVLCRECHQKVHGIGKKSNEAADETDTNGDWFDEFDEEFPLYTVFDHQQKHAYNMNKSLFLKTIRRTINRIFNDAYSEINNILEDAQKKGAFTLPS